MSPLRSWCRWLNATLSFDARTALVVVVVAAHHEQMVVDEHGQRHQHVLDGSAANVQTQGINVCAFVCLLKQIFMMSK